MSRFDWSLTAAMLMTNHFHLVIQTPEPNLSRGMHWFNSAYSGWYNRTRKRCGHLYQRGDLGSQISSLLLPLRGS